MQQARMDSADKLSALLVSAGYTAVQTWAQVFEHRWTIDAVVKVQLGCGMAARGASEAYRRVPQPTVRRASWRGFPQKP